MSAVVASNIVLPSIEAADYAYSNTFYANAQGQVITVPGFPNVKFLVFHYESITSQQVKNGNAANNANKNVINPDPDEFDKHEVPYKSTKEGGINSLMYPTDLGENRGHGASLALFYSRYKLKDGDRFLVPLYTPTMKPAPVRQFKPVYKPVNPIPYVVPILIDTGEALEVGDLVWLLLFAL